MPAMKSIPEHYVTAYETNWGHKTGQRMSKLKEHVIIDNFQGKEKSYPIIGQTEFQRRTGRAEETRETDVNSEKRWLRPTVFDSGARFFDEYDEKFLADISLPTSPIIEEDSRAWGRLADKVIVDSIIGDAYIGENGMTPIALPNKQIIGVTFSDTGGSGNSGMTVDKMRQAKFILDDNDVDEEEARVMALCAAQIRNLLRTTQVTSADYNSVKALVEGKVDEFMGFKIKRVSSKILPVAAGVRTAVFWAKSGVRISDSGKQTHMDIIPTRNHALQILSDGVIGGTREDEDKAGVIYCDENV